jgi:DNA repair protein RadC
MRIATLREAATLLAPFFAGAAEERVVAIHLGADRLLLAVTFETVGAAEDVALPVRAIAASALRLGAAGLIVAHNHPSGDPTPSEMDKAATRRLGDAARAAGLKLLDHIVYADGAVRSMAEMGLL